MAELTRRGLIGGAATAVTAAAISRAAPAASAATPSGSAPRRAPNVIVILVDEMRFPMSFPRGIRTPQTFLEEFMPNLASLWGQGVKFASHYTAGTACSPARATLVTGLYPHQNWCLQTRKGQNAGAAGPNAPALQREFPTYGRIMRQLGYRTPYVGKWHLSDSPPDAESSAAPFYLSAYGFEGLTIPDPIGTNGQGTQDDGNIAAQAMTWLSHQKPQRRPFCLTVSFVNPHDKEFFWSGTQADGYNALFKSSGATPAVSYTEVPPLNQPETYGYSVLPANWESAKTLTDNKPAAQMFTRSFTDLMWGGVSDSPQANGFSLVDYPGLPGLKIAEAPFSYWSRARDSYTQVLGLVDHQVGRVLAAIPESIRDNTVIVFTADHGDYASAHGFASNKAGSMYEEAVNVPLIVVDPRGQLTADEDQVRHGLTSSVDVLPMLASIAAGGRRWMTGDYAALYGERLDLLPLLKSSSAPSRRHVVMASDEWVPGLYNYNDARRHILGMRTEGMKVASYTNWGATGVADPTTMQAESYDYGSTAGLLELDNQQADSGAAQRNLALLNGSYNTRQMAAPVPPRYRPAVARGKAKYLAYIAFLDSLNADGTTDWKKPNWIKQFIHLG